MIRAYAGCFCGTIQCTDRPGSIVEHHVMIYAYALQYKILKPGSIVEHHVMIALFYCGALYNDPCLCWLFFWVNTMYG
jgi:hypothetical protein